MCIKTVRWRWKRWWSVSSETRCWTLVGPCLLPFTKWTLPSCLLACCAFLPMTWSIMFKILGLVLSCRASKCFRLSEQWTCLPSAFFWRDHSTPCLHQCRLHGKRVSWKKLQQVRSSFPYCQARGFRKDAFLDVAYSLYWRCFPLKSHLDFCWRNRFAHDPCQ